MIRLKNSDVQFARDQLIDGCESLKRLLSGLEISNSFEEEVHAIRKSGKSLRGGFAMFGLRKSSSRDIQAIGRLLSDARNAATRLETWTKLNWNADPRTASTVRALLEQQAQAPSAKLPPEAINWCLDRVASAMDALDPFPTAELGERSIRELAKLERRVHKRCRKLASLESDDFHRTRKAVKAWLGAIAMLPEGTTSDEPKLKKLAKSLGSENDLSTLALWLKEQGFTPRFAPGLWKRLRAARRKARRESVQQARKLVGS